MRNLNLFVLIFTIIQNVRNYLSESQYRSFNTSFSDTSSRNFYSQWVLDLLYVSNNSNLYYKACENNNYFFGYFRFGNISMFYSDRNYGSLGFNFNLILNKRTLNLTWPTDSIWVIFNHERVMTKVNLQEAVNNSTVQQICGQEVYVTKISGIFVNDHPMRYSDILMTISSNINPLSSVDWGINGLFVTKVSCPPKCILCDYENCLGCDNMTIFQNNICSCDSTANYFDFTGENDTINCQNQYKDIIKENYNQPYPDYSNWYLNNNSITPFYFRYNCSLSNASVFGGYKIFGDRDVISKYVSLSDPFLKNFFDFNKNLAYFSYKINMSLYMINWNNTFTINLFPSSSSSPIQISPSSNITYPCDDYVVYYFDYFSYDSLVDLPSLINVTIQGPSPPNKINNTFGLGSFVLSLSPCYKTCASCSSPSFDSCLTCIDENAEPVNGQCICRKGWDIDPYDKDGSCIKTSSLNLVANGNLTEVGFVLYYYLTRKLSLCNNTIFLVGGNSTNIRYPFNSALEFVINEDFFNFYMKKFIIEIITNEDNSLIIPFTFNYKGKQVYPYKQMIKRQCTNYKKYYFEIYINDYDRYTDFTISNSFNSIFGVNRFDAIYYNCDTACNICSGSKPYHCLQCSDYLQLNLNNTNLPSRINSNYYTYSCICDNNYYQVNFNYSGINCSSNPINNYHFRDLNEFEFNSQLWKDQSGTNFPPLSSYVPINIQYTNILGRYNVKTLNFLQRQLNFPITYDQMDITFDVYQFVLSSPFLVQVYLDNVYIHGNYFSGFSPYETIFNDGEFAYKKTVSFSYFADGYFYLINNNNPTIKISYIADISCVYNNRCGWGIANLTVNLTIPQFNSTKCYNRPFSTNYCTPANQTIVCIPGYFSNKNANSEYSCLACPKNCATCSSATKCSLCFPGYDIINSVCVPVNMVPASTQTVSPKFNLGIVNSNNPYLFNGFGMNLWFKLVDKITNIENPIVQLENFLINYYSNLTTLNVRDVGNSTLYGQSNNFPLVIGNNLTFANKLSYESQWVSLSFGGKIIMNNTKFLLQILVGKEKSQQTQYSGIFVPSFIQLFSWFTKKFYRNIQYWDRYVPIDILNGYNYVLDFSVIPNDLLLYFKLIEGSFNNLGSAKNQAYLNYPSLINFVTDVTGITNCSEYQYFDSIFSQCKDCSPLCNHCFGPGQYNCSDCKKGFYFNYINNTCVENCPSGTFLDKKYTTLNACFPSCPLECSSCNASGCLTCNAGFILYNSTCIKRCSIEILRTSHDLCYFKKSTCNNNITIINKQSTFLLNKTSINFEVVYNSCVNKSRIEWEYKELGVVSIQNYNKTIFIDGGSIINPGKRNISVNLYDGYSNILVANDSVEVDFISLALNAGKTMIMYSNQQMNISAKLFDSYVAPMRKGKLSYQWSCPSWLSFTQCSVRTTSHTLFFNISHIDTKKFTFGVPHTMIVNVVSNNIKVANLIGFFIIHKDKDLMNYLKFSVERKVDKLINDKIILIAKFLNSFDPQFFKDIKIEWTVDQDVIFLNGNFLPVLIFQPKTFGIFNVKCKIIYKSGQSNQVDSEQTYTFQISPPPSGGEFFVIPNRGTSFSSLFSMINKNWVPNSGNSPDSLIYYYYFLNKFGELSQINNLPQISSYNITQIPPTNLLSVIVQDKDRFTQFNYSVNISSNLTPEFISNITALDEQYLVNSLQVLECFALNMKDHLSTSSVSEWLTYSVPIINKLNKTVSINVLNSELYRSDYESRLRNLEDYSDPGVILLNNINKISNILESITSKNAYVDDILYPLGNISSLLFSISSQLDMNYEFALKESNNLIRSYDNIISQLNYSMGPFSKTGVFSGFERIKAYIGIDIQIGQEKVYLMNNFQFNAIFINTIKLVNDYIFSAKTNKQIITSERKVIYLQNPDIYNFNFNFSKYFSTKVDQCLIPVDTIKLIGSDTLIEISHYTKDLIGKINSTFFSIVDSSFNVQFQSMSGNNLLETILFTDSQTAIFNFSIPNKLSSIGYKLLLNSSCAKVDLVTGNADISLCNTWFDYKENIIQCECDTSGFFTVISSSNFKNKRLWGQFEQTEETLCKILCKLVTRWGFGTFIILAGSCIFFIILAFIQDKNALYDELVALKENRGYSVYRDKMKGGHFGIDKITFKILFSEMFHKTHEILSIYFFKDTYYLRAHRVLIVFLRIYIVMLIGYLSHNDVPTIEILNLTKIRDISLKPIRYQIFKILKNFSEGVLNAFVYSIPAAFILTFFPRLAEYFFRYNENELKYEDSKRQFKMLQGQVYQNVYNKKIGHVPQDKVSLENNNIEPKIEVKSDIVSKEENLIGSNRPQSYFGQEIDKKRKKVKAYMNFIIITQSIIKCIEKDTFRMNFQNNLPPQLSPIYIQRIDSLVVVNEKKKNDRMDDIKKRCRILKDDKNKPKEIPTANKLFRNEEMLVDNVNLFLDDFPVVDVNQLDNIYEHVIQNENQIKISLANVEKVEEPAEEEENKEKIEIIDDDKKENEIEVYAFIPNYVKRNPAKLCYLLMMISLLLIIFFWAAVWFSYLMVKIRNLSGFNMAMTWLLNFGFTLLNSYLISGPIQTAIKVKLIMNYGCYRRRKFEFSFRYIMFFLFITDIDLALYKELKECIKNNKTEVELSKRTEIEEEKEKNNKDNKENDNKNKFQQRINTRGDNTSRRSLKLAEEFKIYENSISKKNDYFNKEINNNEEGVHLTLRNNYDQSNEKKEK